MKSKKIVWIAIPALVLLLVGAVSMKLLASPSSAVVTDPQERMEACLSQLQDSEAELVGESVDEVTGETCVRYHSDKTGQDYDFLPDGKLRHINGKGFRSPDFELPQGPLEDADALDQRMDAYAPACIAPNQIGDLERVQRTEGQFDVNYTYYEYYDGTPTGTRVFLNCANDGSLLSAVILPGGVFEKLEDGTVRCCVEPAVTREKAWEIARKALEERLADTGYIILEDSLSMEQEAKGDTLFYTLTANTYSEKEHYTVTYLVHVDVSDGSVSEIIRSL